MKVAITGVTGNMGIQVLKELLKIDQIELLKLLVFQKEKRIKEIKKICKGQMHRIELVYGELNRRDVCDKLVADVDYVIGLAAVIPPHSDQHPQKAIDCNEKGVSCLVSAIEALPKQPKYIHISTVALYGNRNSKHMWARVGDPLLISPFDIYSLTKMRGEFRVLESNIQYKAVLRQTAMLHSNMLSDNMNDGLMFHTCFNAPLEWATAEDSGLLIANIIKADIENETYLKEKFWNKCFNIGGGLVNCVTGYDVLNDGFEIIGGTVKHFFDPNFNAIRNFHGVWFYDSKDLDDLFHYQRQSTADFWAQFKREHGILKAGKIVPKKLIKKLAIERLCKDPNSPRYWRNHNDEARMLAYFNGTDKFDAISKKWSDFPLINEGKDEQGNPIDYAQLKNRETAPMIDLGYNPDKPIGYEELAKIAEMHGGRLISKKGGLYDKLEWENSDGQRFIARGYTVVCGHWWNPSYTSYCWDFDRLAKKDAIYAQIWYDSHDENEDLFYYLDENFVAQYRKIK
ncbi:MAG: NAD(P)-dependent oxidoreductase [Clostridiales bacterium]|nr:NAD(P)-dependent oxidoreductase [Clostridiales bacterium]